MVRSIILSVLLFSGFQLFAQISPRNTWSYHLYLAGSNMLGDLGGGNQSSDFIDVDLQASRLAVGGGLQYNIRNVSIGSTIFFTQLTGSDAYTNVPGRSDRNLSVRTDLVEANAMVEVMPFPGRAVINRFYLTGGIGAAWFQPKAKYNGDWYKLRELGTEGQNYIDGMNPYKKIAFVLPAGIGYKFPIGRYTSLNLDMTVRKTFTDYLDDVSTVYANPASIAAAGGEVAAALADRSVNGNAVGSQRGNANINDSYFLVGLKFQRTLGIKNLSSCTNFDNPKRKVRSRRKRRRVFEGSYL